MDEQFGSHTYVTCSKCQVTGSLGQIVDKRSLRIKSTHNRRFLKVQQSQLLLNSSHFLVADCLDVELSTSKYFNYHHLKAKARKIRKLYDLRKQTRKMTDKAPEVLPFVCFQQHMNHLQLPVLQHSSPKSAENICKQTLQKKNQSCTI